VLKDDVSVLATAQGRMVGSRGHDEAKDHIVARLKTIGVQPYAGYSLELPYDHGGERFVNIVGQFQGQNTGLSPILLGAHYDTCGPYPGADDNAAAVAVLLAVTERLKETLPDRTVILAFFDAEEPPHFLQPSMGSIRFYEDQLEDEIHCAIIMDLIGHDIPIPGLEDLLFITGMESDPGLQDVLKRTVPDRDLKIIPTLNSYVGDLSDHHIFRLNRKPYLLLTCGHWEHYHMSSDTIEKLNFDKIREVTEYLLRLVMSVSATSIHGPFEGVDTAEAELHFLRDNLMPSLNGLGIELDLRGRADIDHLVWMMMSRFGL